VNRFGVFVVPFLALFITQNGNLATQARFAVAACIGEWMADRLGRMNISRPCGQRELDDLRAEIGELDAHGLRGFG
jgi:hypothetical protein